MRKEYHQKIAIGGTLQLFTGAGLISVVEALYWLYVWLSGFLVLRRATNFSVRKAISEAKTRLLRWMGL